jgi:hypothetical protein
VIVDVEATPARFSQEVAAARTMIERSTSRFAITPQSLGADKAYGSGEFLAWLLEREIAPHIRVIDRTPNTLVDRTLCSSRTSMRTDVPLENLLRIAVSAGLHESTRITHPPKTARFALLK